MHNHAPLACTACDLLQTAPVLPSGGVARCRRCGELLYRDALITWDFSFPLTIAGGILFIVGNVLPIVSLGWQGQYTDATLYGTVHALYEQHRPLVAVLVLFTLIIAPALELGTLTYLLLSVHLHRHAPDLARAFRLWRALREWVLLDVFLLGVLVASVKLKAIADVEIGAALWALAGGVALLTMAVASFDARAYWAKAGE